MANALTSWKEISAYLGKSVRTVQRWEHSYGLPIHRPVADGLGTVSASPKQLDEWIHQWPMRTPEVASLELTDLPSEVNELRAENTELKSRLAELESNSAARVGSSGLNELCSQAARQVFMLKEQIAEMRDFTSNSRMLNANRRLSGRDVLNVP